MRIRSRLAALGSALILGGMAIGAGSAGAQQVSYSVIPTYQEIRWDDAFGFDDRLRLWGVRGSVDFGPYFSLQPFYAWSDGVEPREGLTPGPGQPSLFDLQVYGVDAMVNLAPGPIVPFLKGGGGVLRVDPDGGDRSDRILLRWGGGVRFGLGGRIGAELTAENWTTRLTEPFVAGAVPAGSLADDGLVDSWVYGAGIRIPLGADFDDNQTRGLVPGIAVEPFAVRTDYADELDLGRQYGAGARAGVDFNQNVGLRAFYWRGVDDDYSGFQDVEGYGAEARFALNTGPGISPFLVAGGGRIRFTDEFLDLEGDRPGDLDHLILGGGFAFALGSFARVELGARNLLMTPGSDLEDVTDPDDLVSTWQYSAGLALTVGASATSREQWVDRERIREEERRRIREEERIRVEEMDRLRGISTRDRDDRRTVMVPDTIRGGRMMIVPVPEVGEVILRYGEAYSVQGRAGSMEGMSAAEMDRIEAAVNRALSRQGMGMDMEAMREQMASLVREAVREELQAMGVQPGQRTVVVRPGEDPEVVMVDAERFQWSARTTEPYLGVQLHEDTQFLIGVRAGMGFLRSDLPLEIIPELAFGFGEGDTSLLLGLNGRYTFELGGERRYEPYLQLGAALTNQRLLSINPAYGLKFDVASDDRGNPIRIFIEHQGIQLYGDHRILAGIVLDR
jgi:hypothetical protein